MQRVQSPRRWALSSMNAAKAQRSAKDSRKETTMKLTEDCLTPLKAASLLAVLSIMANLSFSPAVVIAAEKARETPVVIRLDFIIGGNHAPWFVAWEKGFYAKRGLNVTIQPGTGSADTIRAIAAGAADVGFANVSTAIVGRSRGAPTVSVAQLGFIAVTVLWREEADIKGLKDLEGKSWAISPGQAQWFLMPALARINNLDFATIKIQETAPPLQPAALLAKKADFITMFRASNDEVAEMAATKQGIRLKRIHMREAGPRYLRQRSHRQGRGHQTPSGNDSRLCRGTDVVQIGEFGIEAVSVEIESILIFPRKTVQRKTFQSVPFVAVIVLLLENLTSRSPQQCAARPSSLHQRNPAALLLRLLLAIQ